MGFMFWAACLWAAFIIGAIGNGFGIMGALFALPFGLGPVYAAYALAKASQARMNKYVSEFLTALGHSNEKLFHLTKGNSIGVNPQARRLVVGDGVLVKAYDFEDVRDWQTREKRASSAAFVSGDLTGAVAGGASSLSAHAAAASQSGLVVRVRDTSNPEWLITMDEPTRARWFETLTQAVNEGSAQVA